MKTSKPKILKAYIYAKINIVCVKLEKKKKEINSESSQLYNELLNIAGTSNQSALV